MILFFVVDWFVNGYMQFNCWFVDCLFVSSFDCLVVWLVCLFGKLCYQTIPIFSSIKCMSKILYTIHTMPLMRNWPFIGSWFDKNEFKLSIFQETIMWIRNKIYCDALIYQSYLDTNDVIGCHMCVWFIVWVFDWLILDSRLKICLTSNYGKRKIRLKNSKVYTFVDMGQILKWYIWKIIAPNKIKKVVHYRFRTFSICA